MKCFNVEIFGIMASMTANIPTWGTQKFYTLYYLHICILRSSQRLFTAQILLLFSNYPYYWAYLWDWINCVDQMKAANSIEDNFKFISHVNRIKTKIFLSSIVSYLTFWGRVLYSIDYIQFWQAYVNSSLHNTLDINFKQKIFLKNLAC